MRDLSVIITARNEMFLKRTVEEVLEKKRGNTEVIVVLDGAWADPALDVHPDVQIIYNHESIGQRAAINQAARISDAKFIMKLDAHCALDEGFDVKLMADCEYDWTVVPRMYNLHVFNWKCLGCVDETYQGPTPVECKKCGGKEFERVILWHAKKSPETDHMRFDQDLKFQYWSEFKKRPEAKGDIADTMSLLGACFFMHRQRYWDLGGSDEDHGSWGQQGTEIACKTWLSGGRLVVNKKTWFAHMFRTQGGDFGFPYPLSQADVEKARAHSRETWMNNKWPGAKHDLNWLIQKFAPVPGWEDVNPLKKGIVYYTDSKLDPKIAEACQKQILKSKLPVVSVSLQPMEFGKNIHLPLERGWLTMFKQILAGLEASDADIIFFCESDVLYHPSHFEFTPIKDDVYYYNMNCWQVRAEDGHCLYYDCKKLSQLCAHRETLIKHYKERIRRVEAEGFSMKMGFEPGTHGRKERVDDLKCDSWRSSRPNIDIRHGTNATLSRWSKEQFRDQRHCQNWKEAEEIEGWGRIKDRFGAIIEGV